MADSEEIDIEMDLENMNLVDGRAAGLVEEGDVSEPPRLPQEKDQTPPRPPAEEEQVPSWMMKRLRAEELRTLRESSSGSSMKYSGYRVESSFEEGKTDTRMAFEEDCDDDSLSSDDSQGDLVCIEAHPMDEDECQSRKRPTRPIEVDALPYSDPDIEQTMPTVIEDLFDFTELMSSTFGVLRTFVTSPCPQHVVTRCYIHRTGFLHPIYALCADLEDGTGRELIACRKVRSRTAHYVFTLNEKDLFRKRPQRSSLYLGKLRVVNGDYVLYDAGCRVVQADLPSDSRLNALRTEQAVVHLNTLQRPPPAGCRSMEVCFPTPCVTPVNAPRTMHERFEQIRSSNRQNDLYASSCTVLHEKTSRYDPVSSCLVDFKGRATVASVKNFQLVLSEPKDATLNPAQQQESMDDLDREKEIILQMGKITKDCFNMDVRYPLSLFQAFAICMARYDAKPTF